MVLAGAFWQVSVGLGIGIPAAIGAGKLVAVQLFGVQPWDPVMLTIASLLLGLSVIYANLTTLHSGRWNTRYPLCGCRRH